MNLSKEERKIFNLFSVFVFGTLSFILYSFLSVKYQFIFSEGIFFSLLLFGIISYEYVTIGIIKHYSIVWKVKIIKNYVENKKLYFWSGVALAMLTYSISDALISKSYLILIRDLSLIILTIIFGPLIINKIKKGGKKSE